MGGAGDGGARSYSRLEAADEKKHPPDAATDPFDGHAPGVPYIREAAAPTATATMSIPTRALPVTLRAPLRSPGVRERAASAPSTGDRPVSLDSTYGSGNFGS
jgi:hypothetical protein